MDQWVHHLDQPTNRSIQPTPVRAPLTPRLAFIPHRPMHRPRVDQPPDPTRGHAQPTVTAVLNHFMFLVSHFDIALSYFANMLNHFCYSTQLFCYSIKLFCYGAQSFFVFRQLFYDFRRSFHYNSQPFYYSDQSFLLFL
jgi:hypothetical protein